jgi:hypothetical protein
MTAKELMKQEIDLDAEYRKMSENERIYFQKVSLWRKARKIVRILWYVSFLIALVTMIVFLNTGKPFAEDIVNVPLPSYTFITSFALFFILPLILLRIMSKNINIKREFGLSTEERFYLRLFEAKKEVESCLSEDKQKRKEHFRELALKSAEVVADITDDWDYGNIGLVKNLVGDKIDLLRNNMRRLVLPNIAVGDKEALSRISEIFTRFCRYILSPSVDGLVELNTLVEKLPYKKYEITTLTKRIFSFFYNRPRISRLLFSSIVAAIVAITGLYIGLNNNAIATVTGATFWGAFMGFDKLFRIKK